MSGASSTDKVFIDTLQLVARVGNDCWGRARPQQITLSVYLHLSPSFLDRAGASDDVRDSVHYGHLTKSITQLVQSDSSSFEYVDQLVDAVSRKAFELAGEAAVEVRVVVGIPKLILLANGFEADVIIPARKSGHESFTPKMVSVKDLVLSVIIGVNPPEREAKQRVIVNITFFENGKVVVDYVAIIDGIQKRMETTDFLTLEKFVMEILRIACLSSEGVRAATVRAQKPSALSFAHSSGVELTRERSSFS